MSRMTVDQLIGERIHSLMWKHRLTQVTLAPALGITQSTLSKKLRGTVPWTAAEVHAAADRLDVGIGDLMEAGLPRLDSNQEPAGHRESLMAA